MSIKDKASAAASMFKIDDTPTPPSVGRPPATVMGQVAAEREHALKTRDHVRELEAQLKLHDGSAPVRELDANTIRPSSFANRDEKHFSTEIFAEFKQQIAICGINTQPILVRPITKRGDVEEGAEKYEYEIVYGHRRHRACLELGIAVRAEIRHVNDITLFAAMTTENLNREDLSAWELGRHFSRALEQKLYQTHQQIAAAHGINRSTVHRYLVLFNLPIAVLDAFPSKLEIQFAWIDALQQAVEQRRDQVIRTANALKHFKDLPAAKIFAKLTKTENEKTKAARFNIEVQGKNIGVLTRTKNAVLVKLSKGALGEGREGSLAEAVQRFLNEEKK